jgi:beta-carotene 3-hydroxylase
MNLLINIAIVMAAFTGMESVDMLTHKYIMPGIYRSLDRHHHFKEYYGFLEHNNLFFLIFCSASRDDNNTMRYD